MKPRGLADFTADTTAPATTVKLSGASANDQGWYRQDVTLTLTASDSGTGVASTLYKLNDGAWTSYTGPVTISQEGSNTVQYDSTDAAGNAEAPGTVQVKLDKTAPITQAQPSSAPNANGWYNQDVTISLNGNDTVSGVAGTQVKLDAGDWTAYTAPITVSADGTHTISYYSTDVAGNAEAQGSVQVRIDRTAPTASLTQSGQPVHDVLFDDSLQFTLSAADALSGVAIQKLVLDGAEIQSGQTLQAQQIGLGIHTIACTVTDAAGNKTEMSFSFKVGTSFATLHGLIAQFGANGQFKNYGTQASLDAKLSQAESKLQKGQQDQAVKHLEDLLKDVGNGADKGDITAQAAEVLKNNINYLLANGFK